jgi:hypothetical protein
VVHRHLCQVHRHFIDQQVKPFWGVAVRRYLFLVFLLQRSVTLVPDA